MAKPFQAGGSLNRSMTTTNQAGNHVEQQPNESDIKPSLSCFRSIDAIDEESPNVTTLMAKAPTFAYLLKVVTLRSLQFHHSGGKEK